MQDLAIMIFIGLFFVVNAIIKKVIEKKKQQQAKGAEETGTATTGTKDLDDGVRSFMKQIQQTKEEAEEKHSPDAGAIHSADEEQVEPGYSSRERTRKRSREKQAVKEAQTEGNGSREKTKGAQQPDSARKKVKGRPDTSLPQPERKEQMKGRLQFHRNNLVNAVIWSQIFRRPVSLRDDDDALANR